MICALNNISATVKIKIISNCISMITKELLQKRLTQIASSLSQKKGALALMGLGSIGVEDHRLDQYSDLDFFVIVEDSYKNIFINDLQWLTNILACEYAFQNTQDGYKFLFIDGVYCEFAIFTLSELSTVDYAPGKILWQNKLFNSKISKPIKEVISDDNFTEKKQEFYLGELLTNLLVGLTRYERGEKLSACYFIQHYAINRYLQLFELLTPNVKQEQQQDIDIWSIERRVEQRHQACQVILSKVALGYDKSPQAALNLLLEVEKLTVVNQAISRRIKNTANRLINIYNSDSLKLSHITF